MLQVSLLRHVTEDSETVVVTKKIRMDDSRQLLLQIDATKPHLASVVEDAIVSTVAESGKAGETSAYFSFLLDRLNRHLRSVIPDLSTNDVRVFLAAIGGDEIHFSVLGNYSAYLIRGGRITDIAEGMASTVGEFSFVSSGTIKHPDSLYVANIDLLDYLTEEDVSELASAGKDDEKRLAIESLIRREAGKRAIDCIAITNSNLTTVAEQPTRGASGVEKAFITAKSIVAQAVPAARNAFYAVAEIPVVKETYAKVRNHSCWRNEKLRAGVFGLGVVVCATLLYLTISAIFQQKTDLSVPEEYKSRLIEAQIIIEKAGKDVANREVFKQNLKKAEDLIFEVRGKGVYMNDVKRLLDTISVLKKQMNGIESYDTKSHSVEYEFKEEKFDAVGVFEIQKKYYFVGRTAIVGPYVKGAEAKSFPYPDAEEAVSADSTPEGSVYILTKSNRVLKFYKGEFSYVNVEGQKTWEPGRSIKTFNGNLYLLSQDGKQLYKHKPSVNNGFSAKNGVFEGDRSKKAEILDIAIDGGFYVLKKDLALDKIFTLPNYTERSVLLNSLPDDYALGDEKEIPKLYVPTNANYVYMLLAKRIWVFEPDSRDYRNVKSVRFIGQIEVVDGTVRSIFVPKDGTVFAATDTGIYQIQFEVSDGKLVIR